MSKTNAMAFFVLSLILSLSGNSSFAKDINSYPYTGQRAYGAGVFGGTGCTRLWDFLDLCDSSPWQPYDVCGKYVEVSKEYHKWVDLSQYPKAHFGWQVYPIEGDGVLEVAHCDIPTETKIYILKQYPVCGAPGYPIAMCDEPGNDVSATLGSHCWGE